MAKSLSRTSHSNSNSNSNSNSSNTNSGGFGRRRLFSKRKSKRNQPLSQQDICSVSSSSASSSSGLSSSPSSLLSSIHSLQGDDKRNSNSNSNPTVPPMGEFQLSSTMTASQGDIQLTSPSSVMPLQKVSLQQQQQQQQTQLYPLSFDDKPSAEDTTLKNSTAAISSASVTSDFSVNGGATGGCNPFQQKTWTYFECAGPKQYHGDDDDDDERQEGKQNSNDDNNRHISPPPVHKGKRKKKFLNQLMKNIGKNKFLSSNMAEPQQQQHQHHICREKEEEERDVNDKRIQMSSETPKLNNKSLNPSQQQQQQQQQQHVTMKNTKEHLTNTKDDKVDVDTMVLSRSALSRPFGRTSLPSHLAKQWCVEVSPFYNESSKCWNYHFLVQKEEYANATNTNNTTSTTTNNVNAVNENGCLSPVRSDTNGDGSKPKNLSSKTTSSPNSIMQPIDPSSPSSSPLRKNHTNGMKINKSFAVANVTRSLKDLIWLERALRDEYHGALIFPALSMTLTSGTDWTTAVTLNKETFEKGEWDPYTLSNELLDVVLEEEGFLDLHDGNNDDENGNGTSKDSEKRPPFDPKLIADWLNDILNGVRGKGELILNYSSSHIVDVMHSESMESFFYKVNEPLVDLHFMRKKKHESTWLPISLDLQSLPFKDRNDEHCPTLKGLMTFPILCMNNACNNIDDFSETDSILSRRDRVRSKQENPDFFDNSMLSGEIKAQSYYIGLQRENTLRAMYRLRMLLETEALLSAAWKRFAISLSNLFTAGKDIESCKVGEAKGKKRAAKISKDRVDDCLRTLARQKVDRATPSLKVLSSMLSAYYADYSSVTPSLCAFSDGLRQLEKEKVAVVSSADETWKQALKAVSPLTLFQDPDTIKDSRVLKMEIREFEQRQRFNGRLMNSSLLQLSNSIGIRVSRMSWKFFKMESGQASLLKNAAEQVREDLRIEESPQESDADEARAEEEIDVLKRILDLGLKQKYKHRTNSRSCSSSHTGSESDLISENGSLTDESDNNEHNSMNNIMVDKILEAARVKVGCWDYDLAMAILKLIGIENPELTVEHAPREVRTVHRLGGSLQAQIRRCGDSIRMLKELAYGVSNLSLFCEFLIIRFCQYSYGLF